METKEEKITVCYRSGTCNDRNEYYGYDKENGMVRVHDNSGTLIRIEDWEKYDFSNVIYDINRDILFFKYRDGRPMASVDTKKNNVLQIKNPPTFNRIFTNLDTKSEFGICQHLGYVETWHKDTGKYCIDIFRKRICLDRFVQDHNKDLCTLDAIQTTIRHEVLKLWWRGNDAVLYKNVYALETKDGNDALYVSGEVENPEAVSGYYY